MISDHSRKAYMVYAGIIRGQEPQRNQVTHTSSDLVDFVLDEEINEWNHRAEEKTGSSLSILHCSLIRRSSQKTSYSPGNGSN